jgi:predicted nucleotidyltransferase component of viral defense system
MLTREQLVNAAGEMGFPSASVEKVRLLVRLLRDMTSHPFWGPRMALKGGTALNLFVLDLPRLSVDIDLNYIGAADRETMMADRPKLETALEQIAGRLGLMVRRAPSEHAGGKWRLSYTSTLGRPAILEVDINFMLRVPLWPVVKADSPTFIDAAAKGITLLDEHELAAGKLAALLARGASRDLFDARELLRRSSMDLEKLRLGFVVYGGVNRVDWRTVRADAVTTTTEEVQQRLLPMLCDSLRPALKDVPPAGRPDRGVGRRGPAHGRRGRCQTGTHSGYSSVGSRRIHRPMGASRVSGVHAQTSVFSDNLVPTKPAWRKIHEEALSLTPPNGPPPLSACGPSLQEACYEGISICGADTTALQQMAFECLHGSAPDSSIEARSCVMEATSCDEAWTCFGYTP